MEQPSLQYANFFQRAAARIIDVIVVLILGVFFIISFFDSQNMGFQGVPGISFLIFHLFYYPILESKGGTVGKGFMKIKTINNNNNGNISLVNAYKRSILNNIPILVCLIFIVFHIINDIQILFDEASNIAFSKLVIDYLDFFVPFGIIYIIIDILYFIGNKSGQTLHDLWTNTIVVQSHHNENF